MNSLRSSLVRRLAVVSLLGLCSSRLFGGDIVGQITDAQSRAPLPGAVVTVVESGRTVTADPGGRFSLTDLSAGTYTLQVRYLGYEVRSESVTVTESGARAVNVALGSEVVELSAMTVEGYREGRSRALQQKRNQTNISDLIAADGIGNLPDRNVAEAVARLPGVNMSLEQGEGRYVSIRGVEPNLNQVMIDGAIAAAPGGTRLGRAVPLDTLGAGQVSQIEVVKTVTPDLDANSLGGTLKIRTASAFDRNGRFTSASVSTNYSEDTDKQNLESRVLYSDLFGPEQTWGIAVGASFDQRDYSNHSLQTTWALRTFPSVGNVYLPSTLELKPEVGNQTRYGGNLALEFRPSSSLKFYLRPNFSHNERFERLQEILLNVDSSPARTTLTSATTGTFLASGYRPERRDYYGTREQNLFSVSAGFDASFGDFKLEPMVTFSNAKENRVSDRWLQFRPANGVSGPVSFDLGDMFEFKRFDVDYALDIPGNYSLRRTRDDFGIVDEDTYTAKVDLTWSPASLFGGKSGFLKTGFKYTQRERITDLESRRLVPVGNWRLGAIGVSPAVPVYGGRYTSGFLINTDATWAYLQANPALTISDPVDSAANSIEDDYDIAEYIYAGYAMGSVTYDRLTILGGLRWERTDARIRAVEARFQGNTFLGHFPSSGETSYDKTFPNLQAVYRANERLVARAAVSQTIGRPAYEDARPLSNFRRDPLGNAALDPARFPFSGTLNIGNPDLKPFDSRNLDLSVEWYSQWAGILSVAAFRKDVQDPIYTYSETQRNVTYNGFGLETLSLTSRRNADNGLISGIEFNVYQPFKFLPAPLDGLGIDVNYTKISSDLKVPTRPGEDLLFFRQPKEIVNATLFFERGRFSTRLAWNRTDEQLYTLGSNVLNDVYLRPREQFDLQMRQKVTEHFSATLSVRNLTEEKEQFSFGVRNLLRISRLLGREFRVGVDYTF
jgi:TonB-dependent receptor